MSPSFFGLRAFIFPDFFVFHVSIMFPSHNRTGNSHSFQSFSFVARGQARKIHTHAVYALDVQGPTPPFLSPLLQFLPSPFCDVHPPPLSHKKWAVTVVSTPPLVLRVSNSRNSEVLSFIPCAPVTLFDSLPCITFEVNQGL